MVMKEIFTAYLLVIDRVRLLPCVSKWYQQSQLTHCFMAIGVNPKEESGGRKTNVFLVNELFGLFLLGCSAKSAGFKHNGFL